MQRIFCPKSPKQMRNIGFRLTLCSPEQRRTTTMSNPKSNNPRTKRQRLRSLPSPDAIAWTIRDYQAMGGPGRTTIYHKGKTGELKLFTDKTGRRMVDGDSGRALLSVKEVA
jgi:hypothetical protein